MILDRLTAGGRCGSSWQDEWADFPSDYSIFLQPGQEYLYEQKRVFLLIGDYFGDPVVKINGSWGGIGGANRVTFHIVLG